MFFPSLNIFLDNISCTLQEVTSSCNGNFYNPLSENCESKLAKVDEVMKQLNHDLRRSLNYLHCFALSLTCEFNHFQDISGLNIYDILEPCYYGTDTRDVADIKIRLPSSFLELGETDRPLPVRKRMFGRAWPFRAPVREGIVPTWPQLLNGQSVPCTVSQ